MVGSGNKIENMVGGNGGVPLRTQRASGFIRLKNDRTGVVREAPTGFSWETLLFGFFVPVAREWYGFAAIAALSALVTGGLSWFVFPFFINRRYLRYLLEQGYTPINSGDISMIRAEGVWYDPRTKVTPSTTGAQENHPLHTSVVSELEKLGTMKNTGLLTPEEFEIAKQKILSKTGS